MKVNNTRQLSCFHQRDIHGSRHATLTKRLVKLATLGKGNRLKEPPCQTACHQKVVKRNDDVATAASQARQLKNMTPTVNMGSLCVVCA